MDCLLTTYYYTIVILTEWVITCGSGVGTPATAAFVVNVTDAEEILEYSIDFVNIWSVLTPAVVITNERSGLQVGTEYEFTFEYTYNETGYKATNHTAKFRVEGGFWFDGLEQSTQRDMVIEMDGCEDRYIIPAPTFSPMPSSSPTPTAAPTESAAAASANGRLTLCVVVVAALLSVVVGAY